ncbi:portal protein [Roseococcus sp.]|uniref:portal protein n=1 Tax=Roseococcus sp. TaxID=2109646 RepID=UPI003BAB6D57
MSESKTVQFTLKTDQAGAKLTTWANEPKIATLKQDLEAAKPSQQIRVRNMDRWQNLLSITGEAKIPKVRGRSSVQPKLVRRQAEWRYAALSEPFLSSEKLFKIDPVTFEDELGAKQNSLVLNWQFRTKLNRVQLIDNYVRSTVDEGTSVLRVGWCRTTTPVKQKVPIWTHYEIQSEDQLKALQAAIEAKQSNPRGFNEQAPPELIEAVKLYEETQQATVAVQTGEQEVTVQKVIENYPTVEVLNPRNVYLDPSCQGDLDKALFGVISFETNQAALKKEGKRYKNLHLVDWAGNTPLTDPDHETKTPQDFNYNDPLRKKVIAYEWWGFFDIHGTGTLVPIVATWIGAVLIRLEENPFPDGKIPLVMVPYLPVKRDLYGETDAELLEDNQKILGAVTRGMIDLMGRSANGQQGFAKGMLDPLNKKRYEEGKDYEYNPSITPGAGLMEHKYPELPQSGLAMVAMQNQDAEALSGVKAFSGGLSGEAYGQVATAIRGVLDASSKRETAILRRLAQGMSEVGEKIIAMNAVFLTEEETIRVTNEQFVKVRREDLKGNFDLITDISTAEVDNAKAQDLGFMLQTIGPNASPEIVMRILAEIAELKRMPGLAEELRTFKPQPTPEQVEMQRLEIEKARKEVELLDSEIALNMARAAESKAIKDKTNLDYVEQETGTSHERDMEKQRGQAEGNQALEVTKAMVKPLKEKEKKGDVQRAIGFNAISSKLKLNDPLSAGVVPMGRPDFTGFPSSLAA